MTIEVTMSSQDKDYDKEVGEDILTTTDNVMKRYYVVIHTFPFIF